MTHPERRRQDVANELRRARHGDTSIGWRGWLKHAVFALVAVALWTATAYAVAGYVTGQWPFA